MLSAARYPIVLYGSLHLPNILPHDAALHAVLRRAHTILAYFFLLTFLAHFGAILFHALIIRDGILLRMAPWTIRPRERLNSALQVGPADVAANGHGITVPEDSLTSRGGPS
jgi:cytochrome b561